MQNPYENIVARLDAIEAYLVKFDEKFIPNNEVRWEEGIDIAFDELGIKTHVILKNLDMIPHAKIFRKIYFNSKQLRDFLKNNGQKIRAME